MCDGACHRSQGVVRGRKPLSDRKLQNEANLGLPSVPRESPLGPPFLLIIRTISASLVIRLYRLLMYVEAPVSWFYFDELLDQSRDSSRRGARDNPQTMRRPHRERRNVR